VGGLSTTWTLDTPSQGGEGATYSGPAAPVGHLLDQEAIDDGLLFQRSMGLSPSGETQLNWAIDYQVSGSPMFVKEDEVGSADLGPCPQGSYTSSGTTSLTATVACAPPSSPPAVPVPSPPPPGPAPPVPTDNSGGCGGGCIGGIVGGVFVPVLVAILWLSGAFAKWGYASPLKKQQPPPKTTTSTAGGGDGGGEKEAEVKVEQV